jgi:hypothetical protein
MEWALARERLGAELIGARETVATRFRRALREQGQTAWALERCASDLILQAGAALADGAPAESAWRRCGALLRIDTRDPGAALCTEVTLLWRSMAESLEKVALTVDEDRLAHKALDAQMDAALRGAEAVLRATLLDEPCATAFGGPIAVCYRARAEEPSVAELAA